MKPSFERAIPQPFASAHSLDGFARLSSQRSEFMKALVLVATALLLSATTMFARTLAPDGNPQTAPATASPQVNAPAAQQPTTTTPPASGQGVTAGAAPLRVMVGKSLLINTTERLKRVSVTDPTVADPLVVTPTQVLVNGLDRKSTRLNSSHPSISYAVFCL